MLTRRAAIFAGSDAARRERTYDMDRRKTKKIPVGRIAIGGDSPVTVQSMLNAPARDPAANVAQARALRDAGCEILRVAIPDREALGLIEAIKREVDLPLVADIHFDYRLALEAAEAGADKIRINPGNIGGEDRVKAVAVRCAQKGIPIRVGVNSGSVEKHILARYGRPNADALVASAQYHIALLNRFDFDRIVVSIKASDVGVMVEACEKFARTCDYPLHLGVTEAGTERMGLVKSAIGIGALLTRGIGDTIRVSLTADPVREVGAGFDILRACGLRADRPEIVSCPTCGRTRIDVIALARAVEQSLASCRKPIRVAVMGCAVNGPGEAKEADIGIAGGDGEGLLFKKGKILRKLPEEELLPALLDEIRRL